MNDETRNPADEIEGEEDGLLAQCPRCEYQLRGLPILHRCPECGLAVDRRWMILGGQDAPMSKRRRHIHLVVRVILSVYLLFYAAAINRVMRPPPFGLLAIIVGYGLIVFAFFRSLRRSRGFIGLGPDGVCIVPPGRRGLTYAWPTVGRARYDIALGSVLVPCGDRTLRLRNRAYFSGSPREADRCVQAINAYPRPVQPSPSSPSRSGNSVNTRTT
ncbi:MAG TPA: hypothetical protein P5572_05340 [Phycisphaerae bacterium]|nr:hypothetical protein [Phycisphaerae bacterium]